MVSFLGKRPLLVRQGLRYLGNAGRLRLRRGRWLLDDDFDGDPGVSARQTVDEPSGLGMLLAEYARLRQSDLWLVARGLEVAAAIGVDFELKFR